MSNSERHAELHRLIASCERRLSGLETIIDEHPWSETNARLLEFHSRILKLEAKVGSLDNRLADKECESSVYGERLAALEAIPRPTIEEIARHDKAMSEEVVRLRKELDKSELARESAERVTMDLRTTIEQQKSQISFNQAAADTLERLKNGEVIDGIALLSPRIQSLGNTCETLRAERDAALAAAETHRHSHDTLERLRRGDKVDGQRMIREDLAYCYHMDRDALAAKVADLERRLAEASQSTNTAGERRGGSDGQL